MALIQSHDPSDIVIDSIVITSDRLGDQLYNVTLNVLEFNIYESLDTLGIEADMVILDDNAIHEQIDFQGQENITIRCSWPELDGEIWERTFICTSVTSATKATNDQTQMLTLNMIDVDSYQDKLININRKYDGNPKQILAQIIADNFRGKQLFTNDNVFQGAMRVIVPNWNPYECMKYIKNRATSPSGAPYYCYTVHGDEHIRFFDLETMLDTTSIGSPYYFAEMLSQSGDFFNKVGKSYMVQGVTIPEQDDMFTQIADGNVGAQYGFLDTQNFYDNSFKFDITQVFTSMLKRTKILTTTKAPLFDAKFKVKDRSLQSYSSRNIMNIGTTSIYNDIPGYYEDVTPEHHSTKAIAKALRRFIQKTPITIRVSGRNFFMPGKNLTSSIGSLIDFQMLDKRPIVRMSNISEHTDYKRSGLHLIYSARYLIKRSGAATKCTAALKLCKLSNTEGISRVS